MSGLLVVAVVAATLFVALGLQVLSRQVKRSPIDVRKPDPLIDVTTTKSITVRPAELHQLIGIVSNSLISDASYRSELQPILHELGARNTQAEAKGRRRGRNRRWQRIDQSVSELERQWGLAGDDRS
ncbi:MAG: hypothetical protein WBM50_10520 [Acidimicrobiales bacterium]